MDGKRAREGPFFNTPSSFCLNFHSIYMLLSNSKWCNISIMGKYKTLDLHGLTEEEVFDYLDRFIRQNSKEEELLIIVGKGQGIIKQKAIEYLKMCQYKWKNSIDHGKENEGALIVELV